MRGCCLLVALSACSFTPPGELPIDASVPVDTVDAIDTPPGSPRVGDPIALWTFADAAGATIADTRLTNPIDLTIVAGCTSSAADGGLTLQSTCTIQSAPQPHVNRDCKLADAVTFEAWVTAADEVQGAASYAVVAGITTNMVNHNVTLEQRGPLWAARARTSATSADAEPSIIAGIPVDSTQPTHLVVVEDATQRVLYVNGSPTPSTATGSLSTWNADMRVVVGNELGADRHWLGTVWLVAIYDRALTEAEVQQNFAAGPTCVDY